MNQIDLEGRSAVVTGAAQGIGLSVARRLAGSGAKVSLWDIDPDVQRVAEELGGDFQVVDQADWGSVERATEATVAALGSIDILVNNAGIAGANAPTWEYPLEEWSKIMRINLDGPFHCCRAIVPHMRRGGYGRIVNVASIAGKEGNPNACAYSSAKAGVIALTKSLGKELATENIAVNAITPAVAKTRIFDQMKPEQINYMLAKVPRGRFLDIEEAAAMIAFLVSEDNSFTTGAVFDLSGGRATY